MKRWWLVILVAVSAAAGAGYLLSAQMPRVYEAQVRLLVGPVNTDLNTQRAAGQLAQTYAQIVTSNRITEAVIAKLGLDMTPTQLSNAMNAAPNDVTRLVTIRVAVNDPEQAALIANTAAEELAQFAARAGHTWGQSQVIDVAQPPSSPASPQVTLIVMLAAAAGLLAALGLIFGIEYMRDRVGTPDELASLVGAPLLGTLAMPRKLRQGSRSSPPQLPAHPFRMLSTRIEPLLSGNGLRSALVVGLQPSARAGVVAVGLALGFADRGVRTALIDCDGEQHAATRLLDVPVEPELRRLVAGGDVPVRQLRLAAGKDRNGDERQLELAVVPSALDGHLGKVELVRTVLDAVAQTAEVAVIDSGPLTRSPDALLWARTVDAVLIVVERDGTRRRELTEMVATLQAAGVTIAGTIVTYAGRSLPRPSLRARARGRSRAAVTPERTRARPPRLALVRPDAVAQGRRHIAAGTER